MKKLLIALLSIVSMFSLIAFAGCEDAKVESITLDKTEITMEVGEEIDVIATIAPVEITDAVIEWASSNEEVVTVVNGKITAVAQGEATITATVEEIVASCKITVIKSVQSVSLDKTVLNMLVGEEKTLEATVAPLDATNATVVWTSSNPEIATVENGKVTAVAQGEATITATVGEKTATCAVVIKTATVWSGETAEAEDMNEIYDEATKTYSISTVEQLAYIASKVNDENFAFEGYTIKLVSNLNFNNLAWTPIGNVDVYPSKTFKGTFDGNGYAIYNLSITDKGTGSEYSTAALFGSVYNATIKDLTVENVKVESDHYAAVLVGYTSNGVTITNCTVKNATIVSAPALFGSKYDNGDKVGGLVGYAVNATITNCLIEDTTISAYRHIGGIIGYVGGTIDIQGNTVKNLVITQDDTNGYKDATVVEKLVDEIAGNINDGITLGENNVVDVTIINKDAE